MHCKLNLWCFISFTWYFRPSFLGYWSQPKTPYWRYICGIKSCHKTLLKVYQLHKLYLINQVTWFGFIILFSTWRSNAKAVTKQMTLMVIFPWSSILNCCYFFVAGKWRVPGNVAWAPPTSPRPPTACKVSSTTSNFIQLRHKVSTEIFSL